MNDPLTPNERATMIDADGYLSRNRPYLARLQRERRASMVRIDYMPSPDALAIFENRKTQESPGSITGTNSAVLDAILIEWASLTGINNSEILAPRPPRNPVQHAHLGGNYGGNSET